MPVIIGIFLVVASAGYLIDSTAHFLLPNYNDYKTVFMLIVAVPGVIGELSLAFWLLIKGVRVQLK
jgi:Co/Zn/Cd efflux system component